MLVNASKGTSRVRPMDGLEGGKRYGLMGRCTAQRFEALLMNASEGTSGVSLMDDLEGGRRYRWIGRCPEQRARGMGWQDRELEALLMNASEGTSRVWLMDGLELEGGRRYRCMDTGSI